MFPVIAGQPQGEPGLHGLVTSHNAALVNASVQVCPEVGAPCHVTHTDGQGKYEFTNLPDGLWRVTVNPPSGDLIDRPTTVGPVQIAGSAPVNLDVVMSTLSPPPSGTVVGGERTSDGGTPVLYWGEPTPITTHGCVGATSARYEVVVPANSPSGEPRTIEEGGLSEGPTGTYKGSVPALEPFSGFAQIKVTLICPAPAAPEVGSFDIYVDPSGHVLDTSGAPIVGATVTLYRSDSQSGPFEAVPDGSSIMSPSNRSNPSTTDSAGRFGWDVLAGYYEVRAVKPGCVNPHNHGEGFVSSGVLMVPPPVTDLKLILDCNPSSGDHNGGGASAATGGGASTATGSIVRLVAKGRRNGAIRVTAWVTGPGALTGRARTRIARHRKHRTTKQHGERRSRGHAGTSRAGKTGRRRGGKRGRGHRRRKAWAAYGAARASAGGAGKVTFTVKPSRKARRMLTRRKHIKVALRVAFSPSPAGKSSTKRARVSVRYARQRRHRHRGTHKGKGAGHRRGNHAG